jgi:hypothetical protein
MLAEQKATVEEVLSIHDECKGLFEAVAKSVCIHGGHDDDVHSALPVFTTIV